VLSVAGFPELSVFDQLSSYVRFLFGERLLAEIYRPAAELLAHPLHARKREEIFQATHQAGRELVESMKVSQEAMARITMPLGGDFESFARIGNLMWKTCIEEGLTPQEFWDQGIIPRPDSIETFLSIMKYGFNSEGAAEADAVLQFDFSGKQSGTCQIKVKGGTVDAALEAQWESSIVVETPFEVWMDIITGKLDPQQAFMEQKCKAEGDFELLLKMGDWFGR